MNLKYSFIDAMYFTFKDLIVTINNYVEFQDYAVIKQRVKKNFKIDQVVKTYFRCDREEKSKNKFHEQKRKHSVTCLIK